jgi:hypothetical protein
MGTTTATGSATYTTVDVENVVRRLKADLTMIASSTGAWTEKEAGEYAHDIEALAKKDYLASVDVTLLNGTTEVAAVRYDVNTNAGGLSGSRPGGVMWPKISGAELRVTIWYTAAYDAAARQSMTGKLKISWGPSSADTSHATLNGSGGRDYASNAYGFNRKDWTK